METLKNVKTETKVAGKKFNIREVAKRTDLYRINPLDIKINWESNPRKDYGTENFLELKTDISKKGVINSIEVYIDKSNDSVNLAGGFRRMKAVLELIEEGVNIPQVPIIVVPFNIEDILASHYTMNNTGLEMNEVEVAGIVEKLYNLMGDYNKVADKLSMTYQKVHRYVNYMKEASTLNKDMVVNKELSLANAIAIAQQTNGVEEQNKVLTKAKESASNKGNSKIKPDDIKGVRTQNQRKREDVLRSINGFIKYIKINGVEQISIEDLEKVVTSLEQGADVDDLIENFI